MKWVVLCKRTNDPKLAWIEYHLDRAGIPNRRNGESFHAPILEVDLRREDEAWENLLLVIGTYSEAEELDDKKDYEISEKMEELEELLSKKMPKAWMSKGDEE